MPTLTMRAIRLRLLLSMLKDRGVGVHRISELARVPVPELWRLLEFATLPDLGAQERLIATGERLLEDLRARPAKPTWPAAAVRLGDWTRSRYAHCDPDHPDLKSTKVGARV